MHCCGIEAAVQVSSVIAYCSILVGHFPAVVGGAVTTANDELELVFDPAREIIFVGYSWCAKAGNYRPRSEDIAVEDVALTLETGYKPGHAETSINYDLANAEIPPGANPAGPGGAGKSRLSQ